jgi:hypothetical protein
MATLFRSSTYGQQHTEQQLALAAAGLAIIAEQHFIPLKTSLKIKDLAGDITEQAAFFFFITT